MYVKMLKIKISLNSCRCNKIIINIVVTPSNLLLYCRKPSTYINC